ncbi:hypothetical protein CKAN_02676000 [Cinnamomum micranthum f. kanehirae]|uniref:Uncharacterized protein n=1 Tax=Cinnamomum micranthum f. kanehirae TaxID=337451 RepID=A0A443Q2S3_9MAGN|nr:hypothetical protein CKAN_02676000 [Cinnamomum micranthum f. kanehirae]
MSREKGSKTLVRRPKKLGMRDIMGIPYKKHHTILKEIQLEMSMALMSGFLTCSLGTVTVSTPFSIAAFTSSTLAFSGNLNRLRNLPLLLSTRCHLSFFSSFSLLLSPLIYRTLPSSSSTFTSSFFRPGRSALKTWASGVSFQSIQALTKADVSLPRHKQTEKTLIRVQQHHTNNFGNSTRDVNGFDVGFLTCSLGTVTVRTPFSIEAFTSSTLAFSGNLNLLWNLPLLLSMRCHVSFFSSFSLLFSPLICSTHPSSISTFTSSFFRPGRSAVNK